MPCQIFKQLHIMFNFFQNIIAWEFWEKRQLPPYLERKGCKTQAPSPIAALLLVWPTLCLWILSLFPVSTSGLPGYFLKVADVFVRHSHKGYGCGTMSLIAFAFQGFLLKLCCPVSCILRCVSTVGKRAYGHPREKPLQQSTPGDWKHLSSAGDFC